MNKEERENLKQAERRKLLQEWREKTGRTASLKKPLQEHQKLVQKEHPAPIIHQTAPTLDVFDIPSPPKSKFLNNSPKTESPIFINNLPINADRKHLNIGAAQRLATPKQKPVPSIPIIADLIQSMSLLDDTPQSIEYSPIKQNGIKLQNKGFLFDEYIDGASVTILTPKRANKKERNEHGVDNVVTPVRRSLRHLGNDLEEDEEDHDHNLKMLADNGYAYVPNNAIKVHKSTPFRRFEVFDVDVDEEEDDEDDGEVEENEEEEEEEEDDDDRSEVSSFEASPCERHL